MRRPHERVVLPLDRVVVNVASTIDPEELLERMQLGSVRSTLIVNGGTTDFPAEQRQDIGRAMRTAVAALARWPVPALLTGGTDAGLFSLLGVAVAELAFSGPVIGVVPAGKVDADSDGVAGRKPVEPHHTHIAAVDGGHWGDETPVMMGLADAFGRRGPVAVVLAGGGDNAEREVEGHVAAGRHAIVLKGTGRLSDELASTAVAPRELILLDIEDRDGLDRCLQSIFSQR